MADGKINLGGATKMKIMFASTNQHKLQEVKEILSGHEIFSIAPDIEEDGENFEQNALKKAMAVMKKTGCVTIADDSGLEIKFLNGAPGLYSARFLENKSYHEKCLKILEMMENAKDRTARFTTAIALVYPDSKNIIEVSHLNGFISDKIYGENGFGYDPIFYVPDYKMTLAQMNAQLKNKISHRRKALDMIKSYLE